MQVVKNHDLTLYASAEKVRGLSAAPIGRHCLRCQRAGARHPILLTFLAPSSNSRLHFCCDLQDDEVLATVDLESATVAVADESRVPKRFAMTIAATVRSLVLQRHYC